MSTNMKNKVWIIIGLLFLAMLAILIPFFMTGFATGDSPDGGVNPSTLISLDTSNNPNCNFNDFVTTKNFVGDKDYDSSSMKSGTVSIKRECGADLSGLLGLGESVDLKVKDGVSISRNQGSDNYVLKSTGNTTQTGIVNFNGETFILRKGDQLTINKDGAIVGGNFISPKGERYDLAGLSFTPNNGGEVSINRKDGKTFLSLPDGSSIENLMSIQDFRDKFGNKTEYDTIIKGNGLVISDSLSRKIAGGFVDDRFKTFNGSLEFVPAKMTEANLPEKYFASIPANEKIYFPNVGVKVVSDKIYSTPLLFADVSKDYGVKLKDSLYVSAGKGARYYLDDSQPHGFLALGKDSIFIDNVGRSTSSLSFSLDPGKDYAGFKIPSNGRFIYNSYQSSASFKNGQISSTDVNPNFRIMNGPDSLTWEGSRGELGLNRKQNFVSSSFKINIKGVNPISGVYTPSGEYPSFAFSEKDINDNRFSYFIYGKDYVFENDHPSLKSSKGKILLSSESDGSQETIYFDTSYFRDIMKDRLHKFTH